MRRLLMRWRGAPLLLRALAAPVLLAWGLSLPAEQLGKAPPQSSVVVVVAEYPGVSAEEVERQVTIPLEVALAGIPGLAVTRSVSRFGLAYLRLQFKGTRWDRARAQVINRLERVQGLPTGVIPQVTLITSADELLRYTLRAPRDGQGKDVYMLNDLRALQDWVLERSFRGLPEVAEVGSAGGTVKRYEVRPDPDRLRRYGITLRQLEDAIAAGNATVGGDLQVPGGKRLNVRAVGLLGGGKDPVQQVLGLKEPRTAAARLRAAEQRRLREIRLLVAASVNGMPVHVEDVVEGGRLARGDDVSRQGVVVGHQPRQGQVGLRRRGETDEGDVVQGVVFVRPGEDRKQALRRVRARIQELNNLPGGLLPGVRIEPYYEGPTPGAVGSVLWVQATFPADASLERVADRARTARALLLRPEVRAVVSQVGPAEDGTNPVEFGRVRCLVLLRPEKDAPAIRKQLLADLSRTVPGVDWEITLESRDDFLETFVPGPGEELLKIVGPDLDGLERRARRARQALAGVQGIEDVRIRPSGRRPHLEFVVDRARCKRWGVTVADVSCVLQMAFGGKRVTQMVEGEKTFDITLHWPGRLCKSETSLLDLPVDVLLTTAAVPRVRLRDLVSPASPDGETAPGGRFARPGAGAIYREQGERLVALRFRVSSRNRAAILAEARKKVAPLLEALYRTEWSTSR